MSDARTIHVGRMFIIERRGPPGNDTVAMKYPAAAIPSENVLARFEREYDIGSSLSLPGVRRIVGRGEWRGRPALELEYIAGKTFKSYFGDPEHRNIETVLRIGMSVAAALESLHGQGVVHRDIAATNLLVKDGTEEAVIIDLEFAARLGSDGDYVFAVEGQLPYLSPEQTGRIDLPVDERSDLYSFGIVLYEMLTGALPFQAEDTAGWIHAHLARQPDPPPKHLKIPPVVSDIVMRLLAKAPESRYQTARGLYRDLARCLDALKDSGSIAGFALGHGDNPGRLRFSSALYGRESEQKQLQKGLEHAVAGRPGLHFISGFAGAGKTALVNELRFPAAAAGGRFISGKFDQTVRALPYAAFAEAFVQLCHQLLAGTPEELDSFRDRVLETLGSNAGLLLEFVPELEAVLGPQPTPPRLETAESANRFTITLLSFFYCIVAREEPLILFLDDVQWADAASLELLYMIVTRAGRNHFLIVAAYRDNELPPDHPLPELIDKLDREWPHLKHISLRGLSAEQAAAMTAGALDIPPEEALPLAALIHAKTDGNPFFMRQVLETLVSEEALRFDLQSDVWCWDTERINALDISDNVIELMLRKIARLPGKTRNILRIAACIGSNFPLDLLAAGAETDKRQLQKMLLPAVEAGLAAQMGSYGRFTHDRIQQALYQSLPTEKAKRIHLRLGRHLIGQRQQYDLPLAAAQQLNLGMSLINNAEERKLLAVLNLEAGNVAKATMAYVSARDFYITGENLLVESRIDASELVFELRFHQAETIFYLGDVTAAVLRLHELLESAPDTSARTRIYQLLIDIHTVEIELTEALDTGNRALAELGVVIPKNVSGELLQESVDEVQRIVAELGESIEGWPEMRDERELAIAGLLTHLLPAAYIAASPQFPLFSVEFARRVLQGGLSRYSSFAFSVFGMLLAVVLGRYENARAIGRLSIEIARRPDNTALRARANFFHAAFIQHWSEPLETTLPFFDEGWKIGLETGDLQFTSYCINNSHGNGLLAGQSLAELERSLEEFEGVNRVIRQEDGQHFFSMMKRSVSALRYPAQGAHDFFMRDPEGMEMVDSWRKSGNASNLTVYHVLRCLLATIMSDPSAALMNARAAEKSLGGLTGMTWVPHHYFLYALALVDAARGGSIEFAETKVQVDNYRAQLEKWARCSSSNYRSKYLLIEAEMCDLAGNDLGVLINAYDAAIDAARYAGRTYDHALSCERAAACLLRWSKPQLAALYMQNALESYESWGAEAKVAQLVRGGSPLFSVLRARDSEKSMLSSDSGDGLQSVDIYSVVKAAQTVAGELVMDRMLARLIELVIETAGAQSGFLLLKQDEEWRVVAARMPDSPNMEVLQWRALGDYPEIAATVVQYVARTKDPVNLDDASKSTLFASDSSIAERQCKSLLCLPIINRGELAGILYLENNLAPHAFTRTHTRVLQLLTTQAISSLEISRYYARVQNLNRSLEEEIEERKHTESKLEFLANHDVLTELPNRRLFYDRIIHAIKRAQRNGGRVAVLYLDLDQFKNINDTLSHQVGDLLLQQVARRLAMQVRQEDTLGRLGGDEYVLLMEGDLDLRDLSMVAEKLLSSFHEPFHVKGYDLYPTGSLGISLYPDDAADADQLLQNADAAMYQAKKQGRNSFQFFSANLAEVAAERLNLERELRRAIEREEFELYFQPQVLLQTGEIIGAEALLRWNHPRRGMLLPGSFIPVAEESGMIIAIGEWVMRQACEQLACWRGDGHRVDTLAVNVSGGQIGPHGGFVELVRRVLGEVDVDPAGLELELTESVILQDTEFTLRSLEDLKGLGLRLAIDDFGTGYSSLSYLHRLPVQRLKIDRSFVNGLPDTKDSAMIVQSILSLGHNLGKEIVAEGIENEAQRDFLQQVGCAKGQGYMFGVPMSLTDFNRLLGRFTGNSGD